MLNKRRLSVKWSPDGDGRGFWPKGRGEGLQLNWKGLGHREVR